MPAPTVTPPRLSGMTAVSADSKIKPLGYIIWFSVPDEPVSLHKLTGHWRMAGLEREPLPRDPRAVDAFKRAVREQEKLGTFTDPKTSTKVETDVRDLLENADDVMYQVTRVVRDEREQRVVYEAAVRVWFSKRTSEIKYKTLGDIPASQSREITKSIEEEFARNTRTITGRAVRALVRTYIKESADPDEGIFGLSGENMRGKAGGVYFVLAKYRKQLTALAEFLSECYSPTGRAFLYMVPLADGKTEREMIRSRHVANVLEEMEDEMQDVNALLSGTLRGGERARGVRRDVTKTHYRRLSQFRRRAQEYAEALRKEQATLTDHIDVLNGQLKKLI